MLKELLAHYKKVTESQKIKRPHQEKAPTNTVEKRAQQAAKMLSQFDCEKRQLATAAYWSLLQTDIQDYKKKS